MKLQAQAVLRRADLAAPLRLVGVLMAGAFHPLTAQDAWGPLHLEVGLVALAPLHPVVAEEVSVGAVEAMVEARGHWSDPGSGSGAQLSWVPIDQVRDVAEEDIHALIARMSIANDERTSETPSTPAYHRAARELERLASLVYEATSAEERMAEAEAQRKRREPGGDAGQCPRSGPGLLP
ncbi:MAG: hypothetical protein R6W93_01765 [Candidatus Limnocylindrales bacterium]